MEYLKKIYTYKKAIPKFYVGGNPPALGKINPRTGRPFTVEEVQSYTNTEGMMSAPFGAGYGGLDNQGRQMFGNYDQSFSSNTLNTSNPKLDYASSTLLKPLKETVKFKPPTTYDASTLSENLNELNIETPKTVGQPLSGSKLGTPELFKVDLNTPKLEPVTNPKITTPTTKTPSSVNYGAMGSAASSAGQMIASEVEKNSYKPITRDAYGVEYRDKDKGDSAAAGALDWGSKGLALSASMGFADFGLSAAVGAIYGGISGWANADKINRKNQQQKDFANARYTDESFKQASQRYDSLKASGFNSQGNAYQKMYMKGGLINKYPNGGEIKSNNSFTSGSKWEIVKDLKGYPTHENGGVNLTIGKNGVLLNDGKSDYKADDGLLLPKPQVEKELKKQEVDKLSESLGVGRFDKKFTKQEKQNIIEGKNWLREYVSSDKYREILTNKFKDPKKADEVIKDRLKNLTNQTSYRKLDLYEMDKYSGIYHEPNNENEATQIGFESDLTPTLSVHEHSHSLLGKTKVPKEIQEELNKIYSKKDIKNPRTVGDSEQDDYIKNPDEIISRLNEQRFLIDKYVKKGNKKHVYTQEDLNAFRKWSNSIGDKEVWDEEAETEFKEQIKTYNKKNNPEMYNEGEGYFSDEEILYMLNNIVKTKGKSYKDVV